MRDLLGALACAAALAGCGNEDVVVPTECEEGSDAILAALHDAPGEVRLRGRVKISDCFQQAAPAASVQNVSASMVGATQELGDEVRERRHSHAAVELGYLIGAVRRGAGTTGTGVHYEAVRRVEQELVGVHVNTEEFRRGLRAGHSGG